MVSRGEHRIFRISHRSGFSGPKEAASSYNVGATKIQLALRMLADYAMTVALKDLASRQLVAAEVEAVAALPRGSHRQYTAGW